MRKLVLSLLALGFIFTGAQAASAQITGPVGNGPGADNVTNNQDDNTAQNALQNAQDPDFIDVDATDIGNDPSEAGVNGDQNGVNTDNGAATESGLAIDGSTDAATLNGDAIEDGAKTDSGFAFGEDANLDGVSQFGDGLEDSGKADEGVAFGENANIDDSPITSSSDGAFVVGDDLEDNLFSNIGTGDAEILSPETSSSASLGAPVSGVSLQGLEGLALPGVGGLDLDVLSPASVSENFNSQIQESVNTSTNVNTINLDL